MLLTSRAKLWITPGGSAAITEVVEFPLLKALNIFLVGGDLRELRDLEPKLINYAISIGCKRITGGGRDGWSGTESDWKKAGVLMYKDIVP